MSIPAVDSSDRLLQISSIPVVDLRLFSQSELASLSLCSDLSFDLRRSDDVVDPKIDRSIFNESAGSRKQTYSRLRLARRPSDASSAPGPRRRRPDLLPDDDASDRRNNDQIAFFLRKLFAAASGETIPETAAPRPPSERRKANSDGGIVVYDNGSEIVNRDGVVVDVTALGRREDPFVAELRRRTAGLLTKEDVVGFLEGLEGQWGSNRRKKKFVDAGELGDALPRGWKISISVKKRGGRAWLIIRKYISPNGLQFESCKEVSAYLLSLFGPQNESQQRSTRIDKSSSLPTRSTAGITFKDDTVKDVPVSYPAIPISYSAPVFPVSTKHENQIVLFSTENQVKAQQWGTLECHKCKQTFDNKDLYVEHLSSFHRKKARRFGVGKSISDGVIMRDGKYECQFCHKTFDERRRYNGHVGNHVKYQGKSIGGLPDDTPEQANNDKSSSAVTPSTSSGVDASVSIEKDKIPETSATFNDELNSVSIDSKEAMDVAIVDNPKCSALEITQEMSASKSADEHEITDGSLLDPVKNSKAEDVKVESSLDTGAPLPTNEETAICDVSGEKDHPTFMLDETSELGNEPERDLENCSITDPRNERTCGVETCPDDIFTSVAKDPMLGETEKLATEKVCSYETCSTALSDNEKIYSTDRSFDGILASSTKEPVLDKGEKSMSELYSEFRSSHSRSDEVVREMDGSSSGEILLQNVAADASSLLAQQSSFFSILDSDKGADKSRSASQKLEKLSDFEELRLDDIETTKFGFVTGQDSGSLSEAPMDLTYMVDDFEQGLDSSIQFEWDMVLPKPVGGHPSTAVCSWCRVEFNLGDANPEMYSDSGCFLCPNCKAKGSGQLNLLDNGFSMNSHQL